MAPNECYLASLNMQVDFLKLRNGVRASNKQDVTFRRLNKLY